MPDPRPEAALTTQQKALAINLDQSAYGTFAEIGAGQEVARWFFQVGGAAGTIAKTVSAYDMTVSNVVYGPTDRYVSRKRLEAMLATEMTSLVQELGGARGATSRFFVFADTVTTRSYKRREDGQGWLGIRFQHEPLAPPSEVILHAHLRDADAVRQQETVGVLGVNLVHACFHHHDDSNALIGALFDGLTRERLEIDMVKLSGPAFVRTDNRLAALQLVSQGYTEAVIFDANGEVVQSSEVLYKKPILVERGSFRPVTHVTRDILERARAQFLAEPEVKGADPVVLMEMTLRSLTGEHGLDHRDFLARVDTIRALGHPVLLSHFGRYFRLADYLAAYTTQMIGIAVGVPSVREIVDDRFYTDLSGGILESIGRLFKNQVRVYVYPGLDPATGALLTAVDAPVAAPVEHLRRFLLETRRLEPIRDYDAALLTTRTADVRAMIARGDRAFAEHVPPEVAALIERDRLFGWPAAGTSSP